ncbi:MAG TPA: protein kinase [Gammaproteobacteria bacterium]|nr:protein kinase [Gammaproteobacteria bacterium]
MTLDEVIEAFIDGRADFARFRAVVEDQLARHPELMEGTLLRLDSLKRAGRLSASLHALMSEEIDRSSSGDITPPFGAEEIDDEPSGHGEPGRAETVAGPADEPAPRDEPPPGVGTTLAGRYRLEALLGRGGMSLVYRAEDLRRMGGGVDAAWVAVKLLAPEYVGRESRAALEREAALLADLSHPCVVRMLDYDQHGKYAFLVTELLDGERLRNRLARGGPAPLPVAEAMRIARQLSDALAYLHRRGLAHRDVKPANIFITAAGDVRLIDFGLAAWIDRAGVPGSPAPKSWTPLYASPETLAGAPPDFRDDVYSLGCVVYEMLTGRHPWGKLPADEAIHRKLTLVRPAGLSAASWRILQQALAFRAADRPTNAAAFGAAFFAPSRSPRRLLPLVAAALLGGTAVGVALSVFGPGESRDQPAEPRAVAGQPAESPPVESPPVESSAVELLPAELVNDMPASPSETGGAESRPVVVAEETGPAARVVEAPTARGEPEPEPEDGAQAVGAPEPRDEPAPEPATEPTPEPAAGPALPPRPPALAFAFSSFRVMENGGALRLALRRPAGYVGPLRVRWRTVDQSARDGIAYIGSPAWQFAEAPAGAEWLIIFIPIVDNSVPGDDRTFLVELDEVPMGPPLGTPARVEVTIVDDD